MDEPIIINFPSDYTYDEITELKNSPIDILIFDENFRGELCIFEFPDTIFYLEINSNSSLSGVTLPKYLRKLKFGAEFNQSLDIVELPESLEILDFFNYKHSLFSVKLPKNLKKIINRTYNKLSKVSHFTQISTLYSLPFYLPQNVKKIILNSEYSYINNSFIFPKKLKKLSISGNVNNKIIFYEMYDELKTLKTLEILKKVEFPIEKLPNNIKKIKLPFEYDSTKMLINLPTDLEHLTISGEFCNKSFVNNLPKKIKSLEIINELDFELETLPESLDKIYLNFEPTITTKNPQYKATNKDEPNKKKKMYIQDSITKVVFSNGFDCSVPLIKLPRGLEYLKISGKKCNEEIINNLPEKLQYLEIVNNLEFELDNLPFSLKYLFINVFDTNITINQTNLPAGLETLKIFKSYSETYFKKPFGCEVILLND